MKGVEVLKSKCCWRWFGSWKTQVLFSPELFWWLCLVFLNQILSSNTYARRGNFFVGWAWILWGEVRASLKLQRWLLKSSTHLDRRTTVEFLKVGPLEHNYCSILRGLHRNESLCGWQNIGLARKFGFSCKFGFCWSVAQLYLTVCNPMDCSMPGFPVLHRLPELAQTHVCWVSDAIQTSHPLSPPSPPALSLSQHQGLLQWVSSSSQVAKVLELQLQHQSSKM